MITDWFAVASTEGSSAAGVDIEMPGPGRAYGAALARAVRDGRVPETRLDAQVRRILGLLDRLDLVGEERGDGVVPRRPPPERRRSVAYRAAADSFVLLKNDGLLPLDTRTPSPGRHRSSRGQPHGHGRRIGSGPPGPDSSRSWMPCGSGSATAPRYVMSPAWSWPAAPRFSRFRCHGGAAPGRVPRRGGRPSWRSGPVRRCSTGAHLTPPSTVPSRYGPAEPFSRPPTARTGSP